MVVDRVPQKHQSQNLSQSDRPSSSQRHRHGRQDIHQAQQTIYNFLLEIVRQWPAEDVIEEFKNIFLHHSETVSSETIPALYSILFSNDQREFHNTLKRSCYILINNWEVSRNHQAVQDLIQLFSDPILTKPTLSPTLKRLRQWISSFVESKDFEDLELFVASRFSPTEESWTARYTSYLLVPQYVDTENPLEQREAARAMSRRLKDKFKFDLAMYAAYSQTIRPMQQQRENPTALGDSALRLIKAIVARRGQFSYRNLARIFKEQTEGLSYRAYKRSLIGYLIFSLSDPEAIKTLKHVLSPKLEQLYKKHNKRSVDASLVLRTSNRLIDCLMTEDKTRPSQLFTLLLTRGNPMTMAVILLKIVLVSPNAHPYLEARIADLIHYYEQFPRSECDWIIRFLEIYGITFAIYSSDVEYSLVRVDGKDTDKDAYQGGKRKGRSLDDYRVFSQMLKASPNSDTGELPVDLPVDPADADLEEV